MTLVHEQVAACEKEVVLGQQNSLQIDDISAIASAHQLRGHVQMIMTNLPFPPLPVVASGGDERTIASSHDMLHSAIACELLDPRTDCADLGPRKLAILQQLHLDVIAAFEKYMSEDQPDVNGIYSTYTSTMREYFDLYPGINKSICFWPLEHVANSDVLVEQAINHLTAYNQGVIGGTNIVPASNAYRDIIVAYAKTAWTMRD